MDLGNTSRMPSKCLYGDCIEPSGGPISKQFVRKGFFHRKSDGKRVARFFCRHCKRSFSSARASPCFLQKKRKLNLKIRDLLVSGVSMRRIGRLLKITRRTVARKFLFLAQQARLDQKAFLNTLVQEKKVSRIYFDEMESFEHSKCLPVSIPLAVTEDRKVLGFRVCSMPAHGHLAAISRKKYGYRKDERPQAAASLFTEIKPYISSSPTFLSDEKTVYPFWLRPHFPDATHETFKGRRGCVVGQGELKRGGFDPLFALNHTAAMFRANVSRLFRRTWNTTKIKERLADHIFIYVSYHNRILT
jgi:hypothetical protein